MVDPHAEQDKKDAKYDPISRKGLSHVTAGANHEAVSVDFFISGRALSYRILPVRGGEGRVLDPFTLSVPYESITIRNLFTVTHEESGKQVDYIASAFVCDGCETPPEHCITKYELAISSESPFENSFRLDECFNLKDEGHYVISAKSCVFESRESTPTTPSSRRASAIYGRSCSFFYDCRRPKTPSSARKMELEEKIRKEASAQNESAKSQITKRRAIGEWHSIWHVPDDMGLSDCLTNLYYGKSTGSIEENAKLLSQVHDLSDEYKCAIAAKDKDMLSTLAMERDIDLHTMFYKYMKHDPETKLLNAYKQFLRSLMGTFFPDEKWVLYQAMPNIRLHLPGSTTIPPHRDQDIGKDRTPHPAGEQNFIFMFSKAQKTSAMILEANPGRGDWIFMEQEPGELLHFCGNRCVHMNANNETGMTRVSFDFRCISLQNFYMHQKQFETRTNAQRDTYALVPGSYYEVMQLSDSIMQMRPNFGDEEAQALGEYMRSDAFLTEHSKARELEKMLCQFIGCKHAVLNCNGTLAISSALNALGIGPGDQVLAPTYTMVATANSVRLLGAIPILVDVDPETGTITPEIVAPYLDPASGFDIAGVIHVSLNNRSKGLEKLVDLCHSHGVPVLEDAAQSLGVRMHPRANKNIAAKHLGTFGDVGTFSFSSPKIISMGQGGLIVTNDDRVAARLRKNKDFGRARPGVEEYQEFGVNMKITDMQAVVGIQQMHKLEYRIQKMRAIWETYYEILGNYMSGILRDDPLWIPWFIEIFLESQELRDKLAAWLKKLGIGTRNVYPSIHLQPYYSETPDVERGNATREPDATSFICPNLQLLLEQKKRGSVETILRNHQAEKPVARKIMETGLWLPSQTSLSTETARQIALTISAYLRTPAALKMCADKTMEQRHQELESSRGALFGRN
ncbi:unnamed protein product [Amoebophrya sp. A25]|nr:unnamed protein product [Amoebophrya sp. A25]|eukprot:GSA25T00023387001.1